MTLSEHLTHIHLRPITLLKSCHPGTPRSRANDQISRDAEASQEIVANMANVVMSAAIVRAPLVD